MVTIILKYNWMQSKYGGIYLLDYFIVIIVF